MVEDGRSVEDELWRRVGPWRPRSRSRAEIDHEHLALMVDGDEAELAQGHDPERGQRTVHAEGPEVAQRALQVGKGRALPVPGAEGLVTPRVRARGAHQYIVVHDDERGDLALERRAEDMSDRHVDRMRRACHHSNPQERHRQAGG
jgi:hypothetical protein